MLQQFGEDYCPEVHGELACCGRDPVAQQGNTPPSFAAGKTTYDELTNVTPIPLPPYTAGGGGRTGKEGEAGGRCF